jgi:hypothetical protein
LDESILLANNINRAERFLVHTGYQDKLFLKSL